MVVEELDSFIETHCRELGLDCVGKSRFSCMDELSQNIVATQLAATENPAGLVLICPFDSMTSVACNVVPFFPRLLPLDTWQSTKYAPRVTCPVTIMRADYDDVVPANSTEKLIRAFRTPPAIRHYPANHNNVFPATGFTQDLLQAMPGTDQSRFDF